MTRVRTREFVPIALQALANPRIQRSLERLEHFRSARQRSIEETGGPQVWDAMREQARRIKQHTLENLDRYLDLLADRVEAQGGKVFFARDAEEARRYVLEVARAHGVRRVIKSKSMVSEEVDLNEALQSAGIEAVETDLGEYIIQLAGETPFHIIAPAIHKSKEEVSQLFQERLHAEPTDSIPGLAEIARKTLRSAFLTADMGITGVNFAVAETGTIVLVTNEGNGRMCTSMPRVHIALMGMEKVVPRMEDLGLFLKLLVRSATGQRMNSYTTFVTGPRRPGEEDGPEEFHLVILDNGRSRILADPDLREALYCLRCGACLNACPVYGKVGGHAYGWVYSGPIGKIVTPSLVGLDRAKDLPFASTLCGACREVCPVGIHIPHILLRLRYRLTEAPGYPHKTSAVESLMMKGWRFLVTHPWAFTMAGRVASVLQRPFLRNGRLRWLPPPLSGWTTSRDFPPVASRPFRLRWRDLQRERGG